jgi:hypothetical protein
MKNFRQQKLVLANMPARQRKIPAWPAKRRARETSSCDVEKIDRLNWLAKCLPFCAWYKTRTNDPL